MPSKPKAAKKPAAKVAPERLGSDVAPPRRGEPLNIIVARSHVVGGKVELQLPSPTVLRALRGQKIQVKHVYRLEEESPDKEEYRFLLRSKLGTIHHPPSLARIGDVYAKAEDVSGVLLHEFVASGTGSQILTFEVGAEYVVGDWKETTVKAHEQKQAKGEIQILVS